MGSIRLYDPTIVFLIQEGFYRERCYSLDLSRRTISAFVLLRAVDVGFLHTKVVASPSKNHIRKLKSRSLYRSRQLIGRHSAFFYNRLGTGLKPFNFSLGPPFTLRTNIFPIAEDYIVPATLSIGPAALWGSLLVSLLPFAFACTLGHFQAAAALLRSGCVGFGLLSAIRLYTAIRAA